MSESPDTDTVPVLRNREGQHCWHRPTEHVTMCRICGLDANELILGMRADEATNEKWNGDG